jgi:hypothetical protein
MLSKEENSPSKPMTQTTEQKSTLCDRDLTALCAQIQTKKCFERVALQPFQNISYGLFDRKLL